MWLEMVICLHIAPAKETERLRDEARDVMAGLAAARQSAAHWRAAGSRP
jgi:hypothetical protein